MKLKSFLSIIIISIISLSSALSQSQNLRAELKALLRKGGYTISTEQYAMLSRGESAYHNKTFYSATEYIVVVYSEEDEVKDIDVYLYDNDGSLLVKDTDANAFAIIEYSPYLSREMQIVFKNYNCISSYKEYECNLIIAYR